MLEEKIQSVKNSAYFFLRRVAKGILAPSWVAL